MTTDQVRTIDYGERGTVLVAANSDALAMAAARLVQETIDEAATASRRATIALSGGSTPKRMGSLLAVEPLRDRIRWDHLEVFWGDERWVELSDPESNAGEAMRGFLNDVPIPAGQVHPFQTEGIDLDQSARRMELDVRHVVPGKPVPAFDLILLGMGDDGHTASLFPGTAAIHETERLVVDHFVEKLGVPRLTFTPPLINAARAVTFLVGGAGKAEMLARVLDGPIEIDTLPSQVVRPSSGNLTWLVDEAAVANLERNTSRG